MTDLIVRSAVGDDLAYIHRTWVLDGRRPRTPLSGKKEFSATVIGAQVAGILALPNSTINVVCHSHTPELVLAWMVTESWSVDGRDYLVLYYAHTSKPFRRLGLSSALVNAAHTIPGAVIVLASGSKMWQKDYAVFNPNWCFDYDFLSHRLLYETARG